MIRGYLMFGTITLLANGPALPTMSALYDQVTTLPSSPPPATAAVAVAPHPLMAVKDEDGLFRLTGTVQHRRVSFVVDTGATTTVLSSSDAQRLGLRHGSAAPGTLRTASGTAAMEWRRLDRLDIGGRRLTDLTVVVMNGGPAQSLLGQDVLASLGSITIDGDSLTIRPRRS